MSRPRSRPVPPSPFCWLLAVSHQSHRLPLDCHPRTVMNRSLIPSLFRFLPLLPASSSEPLITWLPYDRQLCMALNHPLFHTVCSLLPSSLFSPLLAVSRLSRRLPHDLHPCIVLAPSPVSSGFPHSPGFYSEPIITSLPQFLLWLFSLSIQNYRMLLSISNTSFSFLIPPPCRPVSPHFEFVALWHPVTLVISIISSFALHCIVSEKQCLNSHFIQPVFNIP